MLEYALTLPLLLMLTFGIIEGSMLILSYNTIANAAREGARAGVIPTSSSCNLTCVEGKVQTAAQRLTVGLDATRLNIVPSYTNVPGSIQVDITYSYSLITGIFGGGTIPLRVVSTMKVE